jgi:hypothetical protein
MDRLPAHRLEGAHESVTDVGAAAVTNAISPTSSADTPVAPFGCRTIRLSHHSAVAPSIRLVARSLQHRVSSHEAIASSVITRFLTCHTASRHVVVE